VSDDSVMFLPSSLLKERLLSFGTAKLISNNAGTFGVLCFSESSFVDLFSMEGELDPLYRIPTQSPGALVDISPADVQLLISISVCFLRD
jgi:hypothetical protein